MAFMNPDKHKLLPGGRCAMNILKGLASVFLLCMAVICCSGFVPAEQETVVIPAEQETDQAVSKEDLNFAYMDLKTAPAELHEKILKAREKIIFSSPGWVADDCGGCVFDVRTGKIIRKLPRFHDLFPEDWEIPVFHDEDTDCSQLPEDDGKKPFPWLPDVTLCS